MHIRRNKAFSWLPPILLVALGIAITGSAWVHPPAWSPDGLFYQAHVLQIRGESEDAALDRAWSGPSGAALRAKYAHLPPGLRKFDHDWVRYSNRFFERRWTVPLAAAAVYPVFHRRSLKIVSLAGYVAIGLLIYALLAQRFGRSTSLAVAALVMLAAPVRTWSSYPLTDSWGVALETAALLAAVLVIDRGRQWLWLWLPVIVALAFTRDSMLVVVVATLALALRSRTRANLTLAASAIIVTALPPVVFGGSLRESMAYPLNDFRKPADASWSFVADRYPVALRDLLTQDRLYVTQQWGLALVVLLGVVIAAGLLVLVIRSAGSDPFFAFISGALLGAALTVLIANNYTDFRIELAFVPPLAVATAIVLEQALPAIRARLASRRRHYALRSS